VNIYELISSLNTEIEAAKSREANARAELKAIIQQAKAEHRSELTEAEDLRSDSLLEAVESAVADQRRLESKLARADAVRTDEDRLTSLAGQVHDTPAGKRASGRTASLSIGRNERTYRADTDPKGTGFVSDVLRAHLGDPDAWSRLSRHSEEERIERGVWQERAAGDVTTSGAGGIVVPQYLVDMTAPAVAARRPLADACTHHDLPPEGMSLIVPTITTATSAALQTTQLNPVSATSINETDLTIAVQTSAGQQNVSRQAADRSRLDEFVVQDLMVRVATNLDSTLINQATTGLSAVAASTLGAYADTQPTGAKLYPKILAAASGVEATLMGTNADFAVMHSRRWYWLAKEMTSTWPMINSQGIPEHASGVNRNLDYGSGVRGVLPNGMLVLVDNNVSTNVSANQDEIYVVPQEECHLWEDPNAPVLIRAEQPNAPNLGILLVCFEYFAYTFSRYPSGAMNKVSGTGLTTPSY
jgi:HK97 family phage major capsid protein